MDVSGYQTIGQVEAVAADTSQSFVIVKATEGLTWRASGYGAQATAAGDKFLGAYHFAWPNQDSVAEAQNFVAYAALKPGELACLDMERSAGGETWQTRVGYALAWCAYVHDATGATPIVYANWTWIKGLRAAATLEQWATLTSYPLWLAEPTGTAGQHSTVTSKDGTNPDSWPIVLQQYLVDTLDHDWTPDLAALKALGATKEATV